MKDRLYYLMELLDRESAPWADKLRRVLLSTGTTVAPENPQNCTVHFALNQARRRLETSRALDKKTFGIESLITALSELNEDVFLDYYVVSNSMHLGTCYVLQGRLLGCEFVQKPTTESKLRP